MDKFFNVVSFGELLVDFIPAKTSNSLYTMFEQMPGGAPSNVAVAVSKLGGKSAIISEVGNDIFGKFLINELNNLNVDISGVLVSNISPTPLVFIALDENMDRSFSFFGTPGCFKEIELDFLLPFLNNTKVFHYGLSSMIYNSILDFAISYTKNKKALISFDPNIREYFVNSKEEIIDKILLGISYSDIIKMSEEEFYLVYGDSDINEVCSSMLKNGAKLVIITFGKNGCYYRYKNDSNFLKTFDVSVVDTTGAGDAFLGSILFNLSRYSFDIDAINKDEMHHIMTFANAAGSFTSSIRGSIPSLGSINDIMNVINNIKILE